MTTVKLFIKDQWIQGFQASGHADSSTGSEPDLVCAAVSVLTQTALESLHKVAGIPESDLPFEVEDGFVSIVLNKETLFRKEQVQTIFSVLKCGLHMLEESYGKYIKVIQEVQ